MAIYEMYAIVSGDKRRLVSTFDTVTEEVHAVVGSPVVTMQHHTLRTSVKTTAPPQPTPAAQICPRCHSVQCHCAPPEPPPLAARAERPQRIRTQSEARKAVLAAMMDGVPPPPSFDRVLAYQKQLGLR